jgi:hypothetical protein
MPRRSIGWASWRDAISRRDALGGRARIARIGGVSDAAGVPRSGEVPELESA